MTSETMRERIADNLELLGALPGFAALDVDAKRDLTAQFVTERRPAGEVLIAEGSPPTGLYVLLDGHVEVTNGSAANPTVLNVLGPGAVFGEMSFVAGTGAASASVTAAEDVEFALLNPVAFSEALEQHEELARAIASDTAATHRANLLSRVFHGLDPIARRNLADAVQVIDVAEGAMLMTQGEPGERCFVIVEGEANVTLAQPDGTSKELAVLGPGSLVGEASLLTDAPRNASVQMMSPGRILAITRSDLLEAAGTRDEISSELVSLLRMRWRPRRRPGIEMSQSLTPDGETIVVLKDPTRNVYYRMAGDGAFIWTHLDGETTLRDLAMGYLQQFGAFDPERVARAVQGLVEEGFAETPAVRSDLDTSDEPTGFASTALKALGALAWSRGIGGVDGLFTRLHKTFGFLFSRPGVAVLGVLAAAGLVTAIAFGPRSSDFISDAGGAIVLLGFIPANAVGAVLHEAAHGLAVKRFGREVHRAGVGWYLITPIAFVDTSDMWLEGRGPRALVSAAGPFANLVIAGVASIGAATVGSPLTSAILWQFAIASFYLAIINLNPLLEFDGYYILSDWLDRPNLRDDALRWIGSEFTSAIGDRSKLKGHGVDLVYGLLAIGYIFLVGFFMLVIYRVIIESLVAGILPTAVASGLAWVFAGGVAALAALGTWAQMRGLNAPSH